MGGGEGENKVIRGIHTQAPALKRKYEGIFK